MSSKKKKPTYLKLGEFNQEFEGWTLDKKGLCTPEGEVFTAERINYFHWQGQILSVLRYRINRPEQYTFHF